MQKQLSIKVLLALWLLLSGIQAHAAIEHISLNKMQFVQGESVDMRINLVADPTDIKRLEFVLWQDSGSEKLMVNAVGSYMLHLLGFEPVTDPNAYIMVRVHVIDSWQPMTRLALFTSPQSLPEHTALVASTGKTGAIPAGIDVVQMRSGSDPSAQNCTLEYQQDETLWRVAKRYATQWDTHVYGAILAIYQANQSAFNNRDINSLRKDVVLRCPDEALLESNKDLLAAREKFSQLSD